jgi:hypothetical protein
VTRAARILGLNRTTLIYKLRLLGIEREDFDPRFRAAAAQPAVEIRHVAEGEPTGHPH